MKWQLWNAGGVTKLEYVSKNFAYSILEVHSCEFISTSTATDVPLLTISVAAGTGSECNQQSCISSIVMTYKVDTFESFFSNGTADAFCLHRC